MPGDTPLITTIITGLCLAFLFGFIATRLRISPIVGYLLAGIAVGPYTGGFHADPELAHQLSEIGVILLMFGVGLHFSLKDLLSVRFIAIPGAMLQIITATLLGFGLSWLLGGSWATNIVFGLSLSTASTVVLLRNMQGLNLLETERGKIAVGWLIVEDLVMVFVLVLIPALLIDDAQMAQNLAHSSKLGHHFTLWQIMALTLLKVVLFIVIMLVFGRRLIPKLLQITAQSGSKELFRLAILAITLGVAASAAYLFGVSLALGAFFAGLVMGETDFSQRAAEESLPLRDAFAVLFFVSVGMLFNPAAIWHNFFALMATLFIILFGKGIAAYFIVRIAKKTVGTALTISASLAQIGEFSFILVSLGTNLHIFDDRLRNILLGSAILSILLNPLMFILADKLKLWLESKQFIKADDWQEIIKEEAIAPLECKNHVIFIGYAPLSWKISKGLQEQAIESVIIDDFSHHHPPLEKEKNIHILRGNASEQSILKAANLAEAQKIVLILENAFEALKIVNNIKELAPKLPIFAYSHNQEEKDHLLSLGLAHVINNDDEIAKYLINLLSYTPLALPYNCERKTESPKNESIARQDSCA